VKTRLLFLAVVLLATNRCALVAAGCLAQQKRGPVATITGVVAPGKMVVHEVPYGIDGSQNDLRISWDGQRAPNGPRISVRATKIDCQEFAPETTSPNTGSACATIGSQGGMLSPTATPCPKNTRCRIDPKDVIQTSLIIANGRGNPDVLGPRSVYRLWVAGDARVAVAYTIAVTWFHGPDC
jgi:hypothetical protein